MKIVYVDIKYGCNNVAEPKIVKDISGIILDYLGLFGFIREYLFSL